MARGKIAEIGATRIAPNGYHYTKDKRGWILTGRLVMEQQLGRELKSNERVRFIDGNRTNYNPENLRVFLTKDKSPSRRLAELYTKLEEVKEDIRTLEQELTS